MSTEVFGLALILPVGVERAAYVVHGTIARDGAFAAAGSRNAGRFVLGYFVEAVKP